MDDAAFQEALAMARLMRAGLQPVMIQSAALPGRPRDTPPPRSATPGGHCQECVEHEEDPAPWCDCRSDEPPCRPPCKQNAHRPDECPKRPAPEAGPQARAKPEGNFTSPSEPKLLSRSARASAPPSTLEEIGAALHRYENSRPRTVQKTLGPSELGTPCDRQIALKLAGVARRDMGLAWAPMCGTAVHGLMEEVLKAENARLGRERWIIEQEVKLDDELSGHGDAFDTDWGMVVDWKYTGVTARRKAQRRSVPNEELVSMEYRTQAHLYGLGHHNAGRPVRFVRLVLLARSHDYSESVEWTEEYREDIAVDALTRFYNIRDQVVNLDAARLPERLSWIPAAAGEACKWCPFRRPTPPDGAPVDATGCEGDTAEQAARRTPWM